MTEELGISKDRRIALLIDAENISHQYAEYILDELSLYGVVTYRRAYADWLDQNRAKWKDACLEHAIIPQQQFAYTKGKSSSDASMIIDAMDILYSGYIDGVCLVTSDSDFTPLASRLKQNGLFVIGMGERKTPDSFRASCSRFIELDTISKDEKNKEKTKEPASLPKKKLEKIILEITHNIEDDGDGWVPLAEVGNQLNRRYTDFDTRNYGAKNLSNLVKTLPLFEFKKTGKYASIKEKKSDKKTSKKSK